MVGSSAAATRIAAGTTNTPTDVFDTAVVVAVSAGGLSIASVTTRHVKRGTMQQQLLLLLLLSQLLLLLLLQTFSRFCGSKRNKRYDSTGLLLNK